MAAVRAPASDARFQNRPSMKMTTMPGVKKPVNSWMNWKAWSNPPSRGRAVRMPMITAATAAMRPTVTS